MTAALPLPPSGASAPGFLGALADVLEGLLDPDDDGAAVVRGGGVAVGAALTDDEVELATRPLDSHPAVALLGFHAPPEWMAFGVVTRGTSRTVPESVARGGPGPVPAGTRLGLVHLVTRDDRSLSRVVPPGGETIEMTEGAEGAIHDTCRRVLGLPTAPPPCSPLVYWAHRWLQSVAAAAAATTEPLAWDAVAALHPAVEIIRQHEPTLAGDAAEHLVGVGRVLAMARSWEDLREEWAAGSGHGGLSAAELAWMDAGCFARWCLGTLADPERLVERCEAGVTAEARLRLHVTLDSWQLPEPPSWKEHGAGGR